VIFFSILTIKPLSANAKIDIESKKGSEKVSILERIIDHQCLPHGINPWRSRCTASSAISRRLMRSLNQLSEKTFLQSVQIFFYFFAFISSTHGGRDAGRSCYFIVSFWWLWSIEMWKDRGDVNVRPKIECLLFHLVSKV
jgi:hypothetical protein